MVSPQEWDCGDLGKWPDGWYVFHKGCSKCWCKGPYATKQDADKQMPALIAGGTCPGCGQPTPTGAHYTTRQVTS